MNDTIFLLNLKCTNTLDGISFPRDCYDAMMTGYTDSGLYPIQPNTSEPPFIACCDMETD